LTLTIMLFFTTSIVSMTPLLVACTKRAAFNDKVFMTWICQRLKNSSQTYQQSMVIFCCSELCTSLLIISKVANDQGIYPYQWLKETLKKTTHWFSVTEWWLLMANQLQISYGSAYEIFHNRLQFLKFWAR
jgi:hypothetical protein